MADRSALQVVLDQLEQVLRETRDRKMPDKPIPKDIDKQVDELERVVSEFSQLSEDLLRRLGASDEEVKRALRSPHSQLSTSDQTQFKRSIQLMTEARRKHAQLGFIIQAAKDRGDIELSGGKKKTTGEARRKKFRRVGGRKRWLPL